MSNTVNSQAASKTGLAKHRPLSISKVKGSPVNSTTTLPDGWYFNENREESFWKGIEKSISQSSDTPEGQNRQKLENQSQIQDQSGKIRGLMNRFDEIDQETLLAMIQLANDGNITDSFDQHMVFNSTKTIVNDFISQLRGVSDSQNILLDSLRYWFSQASVKSYAEGDIVDPAEIPSIETVFEGLSALLSEYVSRTEHVSCIHSDITEFWLKQISQVKRSVMIKDEEIQKLQQTIEDEKTKFLAEKNSRTRYDEVNVNAIKTKQQLDGQVRMNIELQRQIDQLKKSLKDAEIQRIAEASSSSRNKESTRSDLESDLRSTKIRLELETNISQLTQELEKVEEQKQKLRNQLIESNNKLRQAQSKIEEKDFEITELNKTLQLKLELASLEKAKNTPPPVVVDSYQDKYYELQMQHQEEIRKVSVRCQQEMAIQLENLKSHFEIEKTKLFETIQNDDQQSLLVAIRDEYEKTLWDLKVNTDTTQKNLIKEWGAKVSLLTRQYERRIQGLIQQQEINQIAAQNNLKYEIKKVELDMEEKFNQQLIDITKEHDERISEFQKNIYQLTEQLASKSEECEKYNRFIDTLGEKPEYLINNNRNNQDSLNQFENPNGTNSNSNPDTINNLRKKSALKLKIMKEDLDEQLRWALNKQKIFYEQEMNKMAADHQTEIRQKLMALQESMMNLKMDSESPLNLNRVMDDITSTFEGMNIQLESLENGMSVPSIPVNEVIQQTKVLNDRLMLLKNENDDLRNLKYEYERVQSQNRELLHRIDLFESIQSNDQTKIAYAMKKIEDGLQEQIDQKNLLIMSLTQEKNEKPTLGVDSFDIFSIKSKKVSVFSVSLPLELLHYEKRKSSLFISTFPSYFAGFHPNLSSQMFDICIINTTIPVNSDLNQKSLQVMPLIPMKDMSFSIEDLKQHSIQMLSINFLNSISISSNPTILEISPSVDFSMINQQSNVIELKEGKKSKEIVLSLSQDYIVAKISPSKNIQSILKQKMNIFAPVSIISIPIRLSETRSQISITKFEANPRTSVIFEKESTSSRPSSSLSFSKSEYNEINNPYVQRKMPSTHGNKRIGPVFIADSGIKESFLMFGDFLANMKSKAINKIYSFVPETKIVIIEKEKEIDDIPRAIKKDIKPNKNYALPKIIPKTTIFEPIEHSDEPITQVIVEENKLEELPKTVVSPKLEKPISIDENKKKPMVTSIETTEIDSGDPISSCIQLATSANRFLNQYRKDENEVHQRISSNNISFEVYLATSNNNDETELSFIRSIKDAYTDLENHLSSLYQLDSIQEQIARLLRKAKVQNQNLLKQIKEMEDQRSRDILTIKQQVLSGAMTEENGNDNEILSQIQKIHQIESSLALLDQLQLITKPEEMEMRDSIISQIRVFEDQLKSNTIVPPSSIDELFIISQQLISLVQPSNRPPTPENNIDSMSESQLKSDIQRIRRMRDRLQKELKAEKDNVSQLQEALLKIQQSFEEEKEKSIMDVTSLKAQISSLKEALSSINGTGSNNSETNIKDQIIMMQSMIENVTSEKDSYRNRLSEMELQLSEKQNQITRLKQECNSLLLGDGSKSMEFLKSLQEKDNDMANGEKAIQASSNIEIKMRIEESNAQNKILSKKNHELESLVLKKKNKIRDLKDQLEDIKIKRIADSKMVPKQSLKHKAIQTMIIRVEEKLNQKENSPSIDISKMNSIPINENTKVTNHSNTGYVSAPPTDLYLEPLVPEAKPVTNDINNSNNIESSKISIMIPDGSQTTPASRTQSPTNDSRTQKNENEADLDQFDDSFMPTHSDQNSSSNLDDIAHSVHSPLTWKKKKKRIPIVLEPKAKPAGIRPQPTRYSIHLSSNHQSDTTLTVNGAQQGRRSLKGTVGPIKPTTTIAETTAIVTASMKKPETSLPNLEANLVIPEPPTHEHTHSTLEKISETLESNPPVPVRITLVVNQPQSSSKSPPPFIIPASTPYTSPPSLSETPMQLSGAPIRQSVDVTILDEALNKISKIREQNRKLSEKIEKRDNEIVALKEKISELTLNLHRVKLESIKNLDNYKRSQIRNDNMKSRIEVCIQEISQRDDQISVLRREILNLKSSTNPVEATLTRVRNALREQQRLVKQKEQKEMIENAAKVALKNITNDNVRNSLQTLIENTQKSINRIEQARQAWKQEEKKNYIAVLASTSLIDDPSIKTHLPPFSPFSKSRISTLKQLTMMRILQEDLSIEMKMPPSRNSFLSADLTFSNVPSAPQSP